MSTSPITTSTNNQLVSVIVPMYNGGKYIESTLKSILAQTYDKFEVLVVNDGSTDDGPAMVSALAKKYPGKIRLIQHPDRGNHWITASRNLAIRNAKGSYIAFVDSDDLWLPEKLERQVEALARYPEAALVYSMTSFIDSHGSNVGAESHFPTAGKGLPGPPRRIFRQLLKENFIPTLTVVVRKNCLNRVGLFADDSRYQFEDWLVFSRIAFFYDIVFIPKILAKYRWHESNYSTHIIESGRLVVADEHYTIGLLSYVQKQEGVSAHTFRKALRRRVWYFFLRAQSWGVPAENLSKPLKRLLALFPSERRAIYAAALASKLLHPKVAAVLRRMRRTFVGQ